MELLTAAVLPTALSGCITQMAHEYTFSEEHDYVYVRQVTDAGLLRDGFALCVEAESGPRRAVRVTARPGPNNVLFAAPLAGFQAARFEPKTNEDLKRGRCNFG